MPNLRLTPLVALFAAGLPVAGWATTHTFSFQVAGGWTQKTLDQADHITAIAVVVSNRPGAESKVIPLDFGSHEDWGGPVYQELPTMPVSDLTLDTGERADILLCFFERGERGTYSERFKAKVQDLSNVIVTSYTAAPDAAAAAKDIAAKVMKAFAADNSDVYYVGALHAWATGDGRWDMTFADGKKKTTALDKPTKTHATYTFALNKGNNPEYHPNLQVTVDGG